ncbi:hypothetical protein Cni_G01805 [Canna indica]|uniref:Cyclin N-terminal domain-containing protein n=1 Tax=Canna indica TaxID=4628 RepID=A0AAQ3Q244_9LILI|nr:hypothetical protein Cni_G01805 [Canna indica]
MPLSPDLPSASSNLLCAEDAADVNSWDDNAALAPDEWDPVPPGSAAALVDDCGLASLLAAETHHMPRPDYFFGPLDAAARHDAVKWILKVTEFYRFRAVTAYLSVNYLDRFLSSHSIPLKEAENAASGGSGRWPMQLLSVACVSVAAKMEEARVPTLLDLQILDPGFVFHPRTVGRMELFLMAALGWRMRAVTPFDFLPHLAASSSSALLSCAANLILSTLRVVDFLGFPPSVVAAAAVLCAADEVTHGCAEVRRDLLRCSDEWVNKEVVSGCRQLMEDYLIDTCPSALRSKPKQQPYAAAESPAPESPVAVLDAAAPCGSCDSAAQMPPPSTTADDDDDTPLAISAEPLPKRRRLGESRCTESAGTCAHGRSP